MSFDRDRLAELIGLHGPVARVVVADIAGSTPREVGASMIVWGDGQDGTIGGGTLEFEAARRARLGQHRLERHALGPSMGQCCGGSVTLLTEIWDSARLTTIGDDVIARPLPGGTEQMPLSVHRAIGQHRDRGAQIDPGILDGWMIEPVTRPTRPLWLYGAGHVGRAIVGVLADLPDFEITWVDTGEARFPEHMPPSVTKLVAADPASVVKYAPPNAEHLILTYSHAFDLELCHAVLSHGFAKAGLIGSAPKWARFRKRLRALGHLDAQIDRIVCPIGDRSLGKHPQAIAVGVAAALLKPSAAMRSAKDAAG